MEKFIDRVKEMKTLQDEYEQKGSSLVTLYGRRRVGKTTLISEFIRDKKALFFLATEKSEQQNRKAFKDKAAEFIGSSLLAEAEAKNWDVIFQEIMRTEFESKPVIVIDEFQYIGKANPAFLSVFQRIWEKILKEEQVMVILCGSLVPMMEAQTLLYSSPLYGRCTAQIRLKQIPFACYKDLFPDKSGRELIEVYSVAGGNPKYIELFSKRQNVYQSIQDCIMNSSKYLYDEPYFLLRQEVTEIGSYFSVMRAIASGNRRISAIATALEMKATSVNKYLTVLTDLDMVEREIPVTEEPDKCKKGLYRITDNYIRFWFAFIYPNMSFLESGNSGIVMEKIKRGLIRNHTAFVYEEVCREQMWQLNAEQAWPFYFSKVGHWWDSKNEIGIAAIDPEGSNLILGECKYRLEPVGIKVLYELEKKTKCVAWRKEERKVWYVLFSVSGFTDELRQLAEKRKDLLLIDNG